jgi:hypothetical protein
MYYTLADYPHEMIEIECAKCGRHGRLRTARLLAEHRPVGRSRSGRPIVVDPPWCPIARP